jgi:hypothetical protein
LFVSRIAANLLAATVLLFCRCQHFIFFILGSIQIKYLSKKSFHVDTKAPFSLGIHAGIHFHPFVLPASQNCFGFGSGIIRQNNIRKKGLNLPADEAVILITEFESTEV